MFQNNLLMAAASLGGSEVICELLGTDTNSGSSATYTISSADLGAAADNRQIVYCYSGRDASEYGSITSVTVGGVDLTHVVSHTKGGASGYRTETWAGIVPSGTSADIVITQTANCFDTASTWYRMTGAASVAADTATSPASAATGAISASIDCDANGVIIGSTQCNSGYPMSWTNITERSDLDNGTPDGSSSMDTFAAAQSSLSITCTPTGTNPSRAMTLASWSPTDGFMTASGGTETTDGDYKVHSFTASGTFTVTRVGYVGTVEYLVIAGGGSGGFSNGGAGGAGGFRIATAHAVTAKEYTITVGAGGAAATSLNTYGTNGGTSTFDTISSSGGGTGGAGGGAGSGTGNGKTGGSGGGGRAANSGGSGGAGNSGSFDPVEGYAGGSGTFTAPNYGAGGGGGSGGVGANGSGSAGGNGGIGTANSITGSSVTYASGGGGSAYNGGTVGTASAGGGTDGMSSSSSAADDATANTGGGGGAGGKDVADSAAGGAGGSGIVIIRYKFQ